MTIENNNIELLRKRITKLQKLMIENLEENEEWLEQHKDVENTMLYFVEKELSNSEIELEYHFEELLEFAYEWNIISEETLNKYK